MMRSLALALLSLLAFAGIDTARAQVCQVPWIFTNGSGGSFQPDANQINADYAALQKCLAPATATSLGLVQPDGVTITVNGQGVISAGLGGNAVLNNSDLMAAKTSTYPNGVWRIAYSGATLAPTSPPLFYLPSPSPCSLNAGAGDGGFQVRSADGLCWIADFPAGQGVDPRWWGVMCSANDSAVWTTIDGSMGNAGWPVQTPKTVIVPPCTTPALFTFANIQRITGTPGQSILTCPTGPAAIRCWLYDGTGPFTLDNVVVSCSNYVVIGALIAPAGCPATSAIFEMEANGGSTEITGVTIDNVDIIGGRNNGITLVSVANAKVHIGKCMAVFNSCVVDTLGNGNGQGTVANVNFHVDSCIMPGGYCVSVPGNGPASGAYLAGSKITITIDQCIGAGWLSAKACADNTGSVEDSSDVRITSFDSQFVLEDKHTTWTSNGVPNAYTNNYTNVVAFRHHDGFGEFADVLFPFETNYLTNPANTAAQYSNLRADLTCHYTPSGAWIASQYYPAGAVYNNGTSNYMVLPQADGAGGVSGSGSAPTGTAAATGYADGTAIVEYLGPYTVTPTKDTCAQIWAINNFDINVSVQGYFGGVQIIPEGSGPTIGTGTNLTSNGSITVKGHVTGECIFDAYPTEFGPANAGVDNVTIRDSDCSTSSATLPAVAIGFSDGGIGYTVAWANILIQASHFASANAPALQTFGGVIFGAIVDSRFEGYNAAILFGGPIGLTIDGGSFKSTAGANGVFSSGSGASGSVNILSPTGTINAGSTSVGNVTVSGGSTLTVTGIMADTATAGTPTAKCSPGEQALDTAGTHLYACHPANTWNTAW